MNFSYKNRENIVGIRVHSLGSDKKRLLKTVTGIALGIAAGSLMRLLLGDEIAMQLKTAFIQPTQQLFLNAFNNII